MIDLIQSLISICTNDTDISALAGTRVWGQELGKSESDNMPRYNVVLKMAGLGGGIGDRDYRPVMEVRVDIFNYGATIIKATNLHRQTHDTFKAINRKFQGDTLIHWAHRTAGPIYLRDPDGSPGWPLVVESWNVLATETTVA